MQKIISVFQRNYETDRLIRNEVVPEYLEQADIEGVVFHHFDGRMAKVKKKDYGMKRQPQPTTRKEC
jgi:hypothetical protein